MAKSSYLSGSAKARSSYLQGSTKRGSSYLQGESAGYDPAEGAPPDAQPETHWWDTAVGAGRGIVDLISRGVYASAGAAEEALSPKGGGLAAVPGRIASELGSGLGPVAGQKREYTQVMERAGVGDLGRLSDVLPYHESPVGMMRKGGILDFTGRGALGFAADVFLDPTTYLTLGGSVARKFATASGIKYLSKAGIAKKAEIVSEEASKVLDKMIAETSDPVLRETARRQARTALEVRMDQEIAKNPKLLDKTGLKLFGQEIVPERTLKGLSSAAKEIVLAVPGGEKAALLAKNVGDTWAGWWDRFATLRGLDENVKEPIKNKIREYSNTIAAHSAIDAERWAPLEAEKVRLARKYGKGDEGVQVLGKKFAQWREGTGTPSLTREETAHFQDVAKWLDERGDMLVKNGVLTPEQYAKYQGKFVHHDYKNKEVLGEATNQGAKMGLINPSRTLEDRVFDTYADAERISEGIRKQGILDRERGGVTPVYGKLIPEYDYMKTTWQSVEQGNKKVWQSKLLDDLKQYGIEDAGYDPSRAYALTDAIQVKPSDRKIIEGFLDRHENLAGLAKSFETDIVPTETAGLKLAKQNLQQAYDEWNTVKFFEPEAKKRGAHAAQVEVYAERLKTAQKIHDRELKAAVKDVPTGAEGWSAIGPEIKATLSRLSPDGQRELTRQLASMARSPSQMFRIEDAVGEKLMPTINAKKPGDIEPFFMRYGLTPEQSTLVPVEGGMWGEKKRLIPKAIVDAIDDMPRDFVMDAATKMHAQKIVGAFDKYTNWFKAMTYPFYPAGATRDIYNNLQHSFLALGLGGLARPGLAGKIVAGSEDAIKIGARKLTGKQWNTLAKDLRVTDPSAASFVQFTGEREAEKAGLLSRARSARGSIDNATRTQLWANGMAMGMTPEDAARMVHDFHYNYSELSHVDNFAAKRVVPFWVFPRKTISLYAKQIPRTPGRFANLAKPFMGREDENQTMSKWEGEGFKIRLERNGKNLTMLNGVDLPVRAIDMLWRGSPDRTLATLVSSMSPAIKVPAQIATGYDLFRGKPYGRGDVPTIGRLLWDKPGVQPIRDFIGLQRTRDAAGRDKYTANMERVQPILEALLISRIFSTSDRQFRLEAQNPSTAKGLLDVIDNFLNINTLTGLQKKTLNLEDEAAKRKIEDRKAWLEDQVKKGQMKEFRRVYK